MVKRVAVAVGILLLLGVSSAIIVPWVLDIDRYRPQLVELVQKKINGRFEVEKLSLSLWGQIRIGIKGVKISGLSESEAGSEARSEVLTLKEVYFYIPFFPLLSGSPIVKFQITEPEIKIKKSKDGKLNILSMIKTGSNTEPSSTSSSIGPKGSTSPIPSFSSYTRFSDLIKKSQLGIELHQAQLQYSDESTGAVDEMKGSVRFEAEMQKVEHQGRLTIQAPMLELNQIKMTDILCKMNFKEGMIDIAPCGLNVFSGAVQGDAHLQSGPNIPTYEFHVQGAGLVIEEATDSQVGLLKNMMTGKLGFQLNGQGEMLTPLKMKGHWKVDQGQFRTIDVVKMVSEASNGALQKLADKIPLAKGKIPTRIAGKIPNHRISYEEISSDFTISDGKFSAPNFYAKAISGKGVDLKGDVAVGLKDHSLNATWDVVDTYNLTKLRDVSFEHNSVKVEHLFTEGSSPVHFTVHIGCTLQAPCPSYEEVPQQLLRVALKNASKTFDEKSKEEIKKKAESFIKKALPPELQQKVTEGLNRLFH